MKNRKMNIKYVIFDFDGVIANTEESNGNFLAKAFNEYGIRFTKEDMYRLIGLNNSSELQGILNRASKQITMEEFMETRKKIGNTYENSKIQPMPGLIALIVYLRDRGIKMAIATSTSTKLIITALNRMHMLPYFECIVCGDMCDRKKPDPQVYQKAMEYLSAMPQDCIVIEDSTIGITAGKNAGAYVIGYGGSGIKQNREEADLIINTYDQCLHKIIEILNGCDK
ncbi:HAD family hydrolase [Anaerocolumna chitinilytica]|nr:HAD family phosphatase [Anaerocolumna chitinilytica]